MISETSKRSFVARARAILASNYCPLIIRWHPSQPPNDVQRLRYDVSRRFFHNRSFLVRWALNGLLCVTWPIRALRLTLRYTRRYGAAVAAETGKSKLRQVVEQTWLAFSEFLPADMYYRYELFRAGSDFSTSYLHQPEAQCLLQTLTRQRDEGVDDKKRFYEICLQHGLPSAPIVGIARNGILEMNGAPPESLFIKPAVGSRGEGTSAWRATPDPEQYRGDDGRVYRWTEIVSLLQRQSRLRPYVIQPLLRSREQIADLSCGPLSTVRVITGLLPSRTAECVACAFRMPTTINRDGIFSAVDIETGWLGRGDSCRPLCPGYDRHPDTGARITQRALPCWHETVALASSAHKMFPGYAFLGWDIALTDDGPILLEANAGWDVISVQRPHRRPLMETRFSAISALWQR